MTYRKFYSSLRFQLLFFKSFLKVLPINREQINGHAPSSALRPCREAGRQSSGPQVQLKPLRACMVPELTPLFHLFFSSFQAWKLCLWLVTLLCYFLLLTWIFGECNSPPKIVKITLGFIHHKDVFAGFKSVNIFYHAAAKHLCLHTKRSLALALAAAAFFKRRKCFFQSSGRMWGRLPSQLPVWLTAASSRFKSSHPAGGMKKREKNRLKVKEWSECTSHASSLVSRRLKNSQLLTLHFCSVQRCNQILRWHISIDSSLLVMILCLQWKVFSKTETFLFRGISLLWFLCIQYLYMQAVQRPVWLYGQTVQISVKCVPGSLFSSVLSHLHVWLTISSSDQKKNTVVVPTLL